MRREGEEEEDKEEGERKLRGKLIKDLQRINKG